MAAPFRSKERRDLVRRFSASHLSYSDIFKVLNSLLDGSTPLQVKVAECLSRQDVMSLIGMRVDPRAYTDPEVYFWDRQAVEFLRKFPFPSGDATRKAALEAFRAAEKQCWVTNLRFSADREHLLSSADRHLIKRVRWHISETLGRFNPEDLLDNARHGPGSCLGLASKSFTDDQGAVGREVKFESKLSLTPALVPYVEPFLREHPAWRRALIAAYGEDYLTILPGNKVTTVPKTALTDRSIAIEPMLNVYLQLGLGSMIRRRLCIAGFNLDYSWKKNQRLAYLGSVDGSYATIDLSSASDTLAYHVIGTLLPRDWFRALDLLRSEMGFLPDLDLKQEIPVVYEKFSSMGNGATFELETLIFWAICRASGVPKAELAVYGDDICCPTKHVPAVVSALEFFGLTVNTQKSFWDGPFRESCGKDYFLGRDVRPLYLTKEVDHGPKVVDLANRLRELGVRRNSSCGDTYHNSDCRFRAAWHYVIGKIPDDVRDLISSPPYTAFGLWKGNVAHEKHADGTYKSRWMIQEVGVKADVSFVGEGLLAARLAPKSDIVQRYRPWDEPEEPSPVGGGNSSTLVRRTRLQLVRAVDTGNLSMWGGWL